MLYSPSVYLIAYLFTNESQVRTHLCLLLKNKPRMGAGEGKGGKGMLVNLIFFNNRNSSPGGATRHRCIYLSTYSIHLKKT